MSDAELMPAAMEPRRDDGDDPPRPAVGQRRWTRPQWSPVVTTGTTPSAQGGRVEGDAAMEPRRDDGDDIWSGDHYDTVASGRNGAPS